MRDDRVNPPEARRPLAELEVVHERLACVAAACELDCDHPSGPGELAFSELVLWIARKPCEVDTSHALMCLEETRDGECVFAVTLHAKRERLEPSPQQIGREAVEDGAGVDLPRTRTRDALDGPSEHACGDVVVAVQVFRGRLADDV